MLLKKNNWLILLAMLVASSAQADVSLNFGLYTSDKPTAMIQQFRPILNALSKKMTTILGEKVKIKTQVSKSYELGLQSIVNGKVDFSRFGPASYIEAKRMDSGVSILAMESNKGKKVFYGIICVAKDSPIKSIEELKGKRFAFGNKSSTIGRYLSQQYLVKYNIKASDLSYYEYLGRHDKVGADVALGKFDAGALKDGTFKKMVKKGTPIRELARFPNVTKPWIARSGLPEHIHQALTQALLEMKDKKALKALKKSGFLKSNDNDYQVIRESIENNQAFFQ